MDDSDIYRSAMLLIEHYGSDAQSQAAQNADALMDRGDFEGAADWKRVLRAISELQVSRGRTKH